MDPNIPESVTESLYKQNLELATKNKTLSLLRQLYQISISSLEPDILTEKIVNIVREVLEFELVGVFDLNKKNGNLTPIKLSLSDRLKKIENNLHQVLEEVNIQNPKKLLFFKKIFENIPNHTENISDIWDGFVDNKILTQIAESSHIKNISAYPLIIDNDVMGVFIICLNRTYDKLSQYEKESLESLVDVVAIALDRAKLYQELKIANIKLKELDQLKSEFLSLATHQIRAPLTAIKGYSSMILDGDFGVLPEKALDSVGIIFKSCQNLVNIVGDFLDISRIEQGKMVYEKTTFNLVDLVNEIVSEMKPNIDSANIALKTNIGKIDNKINADRNKIKQVIGNVIDNSIKYTPKNKKGSIQISVFEDKNYIMTEIKDNGVGIDKKEIGKLFSKFSRAKNANNANVTGTGLGLYIAKKMTEAQGGDIKVESEGVGKGATFTIKLPILNAKDK